MEQVEEKRKPHILVIGAGVAGLAAARTILGDDLPGSPPWEEDERSGGAPLLRSSSPDATVTILEASGRIGGRIWTREFAGVALDAGAAWVHGTEGSPLVPLAASAGLELTATVPANPWTHPAGLAGSEWRLGRRAVGASAVAEGHRLSDELLRLMDERIESLDEEEVEGLSMGDVAALILDGPEFEGVSLEVQAMLGARLKMLE